MKSIDIFGKERSKKVSKKNEVNSKRGIFLCILVIFLLILVFIIRFYPLGGDSYNGKNLAYTGRNLRIVKFYKSYGTWMVRYCPTDSKLETCDYSSSLKSELCRNNLDEQRFLRELAIHNLPEEYVNEIMNIYNSCLKQETNKDNAIQENYNKIQEKVLK